MSAVYINPILIGRFQKLGIILENKVIWKLMLHMAITINGWRTFHPGLFNPKLQPQTFQPWTFQPRTFQPQTFQPRTFKPQTSQPRTFQPKTFKFMVEKSEVEKFLFALGLKSSWLKSPGLKGLGLKLGVEKSGVEMSFNHFDPIPSFLTVFQVYFIHSLLRLWTAQSHILIVDNYRETKKNQNRNFPCHNGFEPNMPSVVPAWLTRIDWPTNSSELWGRKTTA